MPDNRFMQYYAMIGKPFQKKVRLDFLNPDNSIAFSLGNEYKRGYQTGHDTRAFIQDGSLSVSLNNGQRRMASVLLSNLDDAFAYNVNRLWFGQRVSLHMGLVLPDGTDFYLPQGVFYINKPTESITCNGDTASLPLVDKFAYLDGTLFGTLDATYQVNPGTNMFNAISAILTTDKRTYEQGATKPDRMIDSVKPIFTSYYNGKTYKVEDSDGSLTQTVNMTDVPYTMTVARGGTFGQVIGKLNETVNGLYGYDANGVFRLEPSQDDISDASKPVLFDFSTRTGALCSLNYTSLNSEVYNEVMVVGEGLTGFEVWGKASNYDARSDTNIGLIGKKLYTESSANYYNSVQCADLAEYLLKRKTVLQKQVTIESSQMFHLAENSLVSVHRADKHGSPVERHIVQSFTLPIGEAGTMSINAISANDIPQFTITRSESHSA